MLAEHERRPPGRLSLAVADAASPAAKCLIGQCQKPMLSPQDGGQDNMTSGDEFIVLDPLGKKNLPFGDKLILLGPFSLGGGDSLSLLGLKCILGMGLPFLPAPSLLESQFESSQSFCTHATPLAWNFYVESLIPQWGCVQR